MAGVSLTSLTSNIESVVPLWRFEVELPTIDSQGAVGGFGVIQPPSTIYAQKFSVNNHNLAEETEVIANWAKHFPTSSTVDNVSLTQLGGGKKGQEWDNYKYWINWLKLIHDDDGDFGLPVDYWKTVTVYSLDTTGKRIAKFEVLECFPTNPSSVDFDGESTQGLWTVINLVCSNVRFTKL
jgi:hypothetical protein